MKPTRGPFELFHDGPDFRIDADSGYRVLTVHNTNGDDQNASNAKLAIDAFNTYHATGLTPSELAAQRDELLAGCILFAEYERLMDTDDHVRAMQVYADASDAIKRAITNAKGEK